MTAYKVTVTRTFSLIVARTFNARSAQKFAEDLLDCGQVGDGDWDQEIAVEPLEPQGEDPR